MSDLPPPSSPPPDLPPPAAPEVPPATAAPLPPVVSPADHTESHQSEDPASEGGDPQAGPDEKTLGLVMYLLPLVGLFSVMGPIRLPVIAAIAPLVLWLIKKDQSPFLDKAGKEVVNFNICVVACFMAVRFLHMVGSLIYLGWLFSFIGWLLWIAWIASTAISAYNANGGKFYRFPLSYRLIK